MSAPKTTTGFENAVFVGLESFLVDEELSRLKGSFKGDASMNWSVFNAEDDPTMDEIMSLCNTLPFFAERRVVIIRNGHKLSALQMDQVASYLEDPCDATTLILVLEGEKADRDLQKLLRKFDGRAKITRFEPLRNRNDRIRWIMDRTAFHGKKMDKDAAVLLADMTGNSMWYLDSEILKLCLYAGTRPAISIDDVHEVVMRTAEPAIFSFLDSLFDRKRDALSRLYEMELAGISDLEIVSRIENLVIAHYVVVAGRDWKKLKIHDYVAEKAARRKSLWTVSQLVSLLRDVRGIEQKIKSSSVVDGYTSLAEVIGRLVPISRTDSRGGGRAPRA